VTPEFVDPIFHLLQSSDAEVQRAASAALGNLAMERTGRAASHSRPACVHADAAGRGRLPPERNKALIVELNGLDHLARLLLSANVEVQSNACGCVTNLAILDENKVRITHSAVLPRLIKLAVSPDLRVQRNAAGALLNLTHTGACGGLGWLGHRERGPGTLIGRTLWWADRVRAKPPGPGAARRAGGAGTHPGVAARYGRAVLLRSSTQQPCC
jgi:hypothetical protein